MQRSKATVLLLLFSSLTLADLNLDFDHILNGKAPVSTEAIDQMYSKFVEHFRSDEGIHPAKHYYSSNVDHKSVFANKV